MIVTITRTTSAITSKPIEAATYGGKTISTGSMTSTPRYFINAIKHDHEADKHAQPNEDMFDMAPIYFRHHTLLAINHTTVARKKAAPMNSAARYLSVFSGIYSVGIRADSPPVAGSATLTPTAASALTMNCTS